MDLNEFIAELQRNAQLWESVKEWARLAIEEYENRWAHLSLTALNDARDILAEEEVANA